jgi:hypothetical protein
MTSNTKSQPKTSPDEAVKKAVAETPGATIGGVAQVAGIAVSTAGKVLGRLADNKAIIRHKGGRDGGKRLPDRFTLAGVDLPAAYAKHTAASAAPDEPTATAAGKPGSKTGGSGAKGGKPSGSKGADGAGPAGKSAPTVGGDRRLKAGGLDPLVLKYLKDNADTAPHGAGAVAKALERSSGAVGNCLVRLTNDKKIRQDSDSPRRYSLVA